MPALLSRAWMCGPCGKEQPLVMTLNKAGQLCQQCPECQTQFGAALSKPQADTSGGTRETIRPSPTVSLDGGDGVNASWLRGDARRAPLLATTNAPPQAQARVAPGMRTASLTPGDIINQVRARVADLDMELARLDGLKIERKQLQSMLRVADKIAAQQTALASVACLISDAPDTRQ